MAHRIHILGASGSGTSSLGRAIASQLRIPHFDTDDYFWVKTDVPYTVKTDIPARIERLGADLMENREWVLSGSLTGWGDFAIPLFTLVVFLWIPHEVRMERLKAREIDRYGLTAISSGGWFHKNHEEFMAWAAKYDLPGTDMRKRELHEQWMSKLPSKLLRIEGLSTLEDSVGRIMETLSLIEGGS